MNEKNETLELLEPIHYKSGSFKNISASIFLILIWITLLLKDSDSDAFIIFEIIIPVIVYFVANASFKRIYLYSNGIKIAYLLPNIFQSNAIINYGQTTCVEFNESGQQLYTSKLGVLIEIIRAIANRDKDSIKIIYLEKKRTKSNTFNVDLVYNQVLHLADMLIEKKVAVKLNSFARYKKW
jgi:hypothetical protein